MQNHVLKLKLATLVVLTAATAPMGCSSIKSNLYFDDGCQNCTKVKMKLKGVPTTLNVPTHLRVSVLRTRYGRIDDKGLVTFERKLETRETAIEKIYQKEIFTVDFKRPAAGTLKYKLTFGGDENPQYIKKIENESVDQTIEKVTGLITAILETIPPARGGFRIDRSIETKLHPFQDVIASEVFALNEPGLENRIQEFLNVYVNECHSTCPPCVYPGPPPPCFSLEPGCQQPATAPVELGSPRATGQEVVGQAHQHQPR